MKKLILVLMGTTIGLLTVAQPPGPKCGNFGQKNKKDIEAAKIAIITKKLELSSEQAQKFWPVYNEYERKQKEIKKSMRAIHEREPKSDADYTKIIDDITKMREDELNLDKEYKSKFLNVITPGQLVALYKSEHEFKKMLIHNLDERRMGQRQMHGAPPTSR